MSAMPFARTLLTGTFLIGLASSAFALDAGDFAKTLNAAYAKSGGSIVFSKADADGDTVVLHDATFVFAGTHKLKLGDLTFSGVEQGDGGAYTADKMSLPDIDYKRGKNELTVANIEVDGLEIPPLHAQEGSAPAIVYEKASTGAVHLSSPGGEVMALSGITSNVDETDDPEGYTSKLAGEGLILHLDRLGRRPKLHKAIEALGYQTVKGNFELDGSWQTKSGRVGLSQMALDLDEVGKLNLGMDFSGYTVDFMKSLNELREKAMANPNDPKAQQALGIGMMGLMQQLTFTSASIGFTDDSVTRKVLDYIGKQQGVSGDQVAKLAGAMLPLALGRLKNPDFEQQITDAVSKFLDNPKTIRIKAQPINPVAMPVVVSTAIAAPKSLPKLLGITVTANQ